MAATFVVTDIDGTITDESGRLHASAVRTMLELEAEGIGVGLVSGRPYAVVRTLGEYLGLTGPLVAENGGIGFFRNKEWLLGDKRVVEEPVQMLSRLFPIQPTWDTRYRETDYAIERSVDLELIKKELDEKGYEIELQVSSIMIHFAKKGVTKFSGLEVFMDLANITPGDVVVAGDSDSDQSLFEGFPISIAPANSTDSVIKLASYPSLARFGDGFCEGIQKLRQLNVLQRPFLNANS